MDDPLNTMLEHNGDIDEMTEEEVKENFTNPVALPDEDKEKEEEEKEEQEEKKEAKIEEESPHPNPLPKGEEIKEQEDESLERMVKLVEGDNELLLKLAKSEQASDITLAKAVSEKVFGMSLQEALEDMGHESPSTLSDIELEEKTQKMADEKFAQRIQEQDKKSFIKSSEYINSDSEKYDKKVAESFENYMDKLKSNTNETEEEFKTRMEDAHYLASKDKREIETQTKAQEKADIEAAKRLHSSAGSGGTEKQKQKNSNTSFLDKFDNSD